MDERVYLHAHVYAYTPKKMHTFLNTEHIHSTWIADAARFAAVE